MISPFLTIRESSLITVEPCIVYWLEWYNSGSTVKFTLYDATYADPQANQIPREASATQQIGHNFGRGALFPNGLYIEMPSALDYVIIGYEPVTLVNQV